jgi:cell wall-associated NlpC family hydrolase
MRLLAAAFSALILLVVAPGASAASWAQLQIRTAVASGLMGPSVQGFRPEAPLTRADLARIVAGITREEQVATDPGRAVTMTELNRALVRALGLGPAGTAVRRELAAAGLTPPSRAGWETVARLLQLRYNHPAAHDGRERLPTDPATRAEAAFSVARLLDLSPADLERVGELASSFDVPELTEWQRRVLQRAVRFVGYPYVWGGMSESRQTLFGVTSRGGFDCSGFVWRVYKLEPWRGAPTLGTTLRGRTTFQMSGEVGHARRIALSAVRAADVVFFGRGPASRPAEVTHMGIAMGGGWFVHSSGQGTTIAPLAGWYASGFAWARRPLAEAGLE